MMNLLKQVCFIPFSLIIFGCNTIPSNDIFSSNIISSLDQFKIVSKDSSISPEELLISGTNINIEMWSDTTQAVATKSFVLELILNEEINLTKSKRVILLYTDTLYNTPEKGNPSFSKIRYRWFAMKNDSGVYEPIGFPDDYPANSIVGYFNDYFEKLYGSKNTLRLKLQIEGVAGIAVEGLQSFKNKFNYKLSGLEVLVIEDF